MAALSAIARSPRLESLRLDLTGQGQGIDQLGLELLAGFLVYAR